MDEATAVGRDARVGKLRGTRLELEGGLQALVTMHPSAILRADADREARRGELVADLGLARELLGEIRAERAAA